MGSVSDVVDVSVNWMGYIGDFACTQARPRRPCTMKVSDILRVGKHPSTPSSRRTNPLAQAAGDGRKDIGSLVVMELGDLVGMLTFRE